MAKPIGDLPAASGIGANDKFVLEQDEIAKSLTGQILLNWLTAAADGHGGIKSVEKLSTVGLTDTYRITLADTTKFDYKVTNGKGIVGISKTGTSGLVDTYTITYNDGSTYKITVTNGEKGDPFTYDDFTPEQLSALKGNPGDPATLESSVTEYQVGDSGTNIPTGAWGTTIPAVAQGKYLWTRVTQNFNTGNPVVFYAVSRNGMDGSGSVVSVNGVSPDASGNVALTANDIGAEAKQKYGKLVVFGDSLGQGVNNGDYSFVDVLAESGAFSSVAKHCVGSATIGPYQVDSAASGYSLVEQIERYSADVAAADIIMLEYGANDIMSIMAGNITMGTADDDATATTVCGYTKQALERIRELNPDVKIIWLPFIRDNWQYLNAMRGAAYADPELLLEATALVLARPYLASVIPLADGITGAEFSSDGVHPNTAGHIYLANKILHGMFATADYPKLYRPLTMTGDVESGTLALDGNWANIYQLISAGVGVQVTYLFGGSYPMVFYPGMYNAGEMIFNAMATNDGSDLYNISFTWSSNGSITPHFTDLAHKITDISGVFNTDLVNTEASNVCTGVKSGHVVTLSVEITVKEDRTDTWGNFVLATGVPEAHAVTRAMAYFDGWQDFLYIEATTSGTINAIIKGVSAGGKRIIGSITYIAAE